MSGLSESEILYLRVRNVMRRALGLASALTGAGLMVWALLSPRGAFAWLVAGAVCLVCGAVGLLQRSERPDLGPRYSGRQRWWTGDPIEGQEAQPDFTSRAADSGR